LRVEIPQAMLEEGENLVSLVASEDEMDASLLDTIRLTYWHSSMADDNSLRFMVRGGVGFPSVALVIPTSGYLTSAIQMRWLRSSEGGASEGGLCRRFQGSWSWGADAVGADRW